VFKVVDKTRGVREVQTYDIFLDRGGEAKGSLLVDDVQEEIKERKVNESESKRKSGTWRTIPKGHRRPRPGSGAQA